VKKDKCTLERVYRKVLALEKMIASSRWELLSLNDRMGNINTRVQAVDADVKRMGTSMLPVVRHCDRLMREKITLQRQLAEANKFMAAAPTLREAESKEKEDVTIYQTMGASPAGSVAPWGNFRREFVSPQRSWNPCAFAHLHRAGIECAVCGSTPDRKGAPQ
jgi:predicted RecB family endonuclease